MEENKNTPAAEESKAAPTRKGGLYARVNMSVKTANILVTVLIAAMIIVTGYIVNHNGFTVEFDTDGGSRIDSVKVMYSETVPVTEEPVKEGWEFTGWYTDPDRTESFDIEEDPVTGSMTLYAGWEEAE